MGGMGGPLIVSYGGGTNSTAMLVGLHERGERPVAIIFADTGGEKPETYSHLKTMSAWCEAAGFPQIQTVRGAQPQQIKDGSLEGECLRKSMLPSKAFGRSSCSIKWKIDPQVLWLRKWIAEHRPTSKPIKLMGFDADEPSRAEKVTRRGEDGLAEFRFPLIEWDWGRPECVEAIKRAGLPQPGKSACFFCPSSKAHEIFWLKKNHPELAKRALGMERRAIESGKLDTVRGLGRSWSWADLLNQVVMPDDWISPETDCGCYDGDDS